MERMPVLFIGHGSPMNAIEDNEFSSAWKNLAVKIPIPKAILAISAHWYTKDTRIATVEQPRQIYDMYGFPQELYDVKYPAKGEIQLAQRVQELLAEKIIVDNTWGIDHGTWSVLHRMYPDADIPVVQLSVAKNISAEAHYRLGKQLQVLRSEGILILASGNVVHNLSLVNWEMTNGYDWAVSFDDYIKQNILSKNYDNVIAYEKAGDEAKKAFFSPDHFYPLLYAMGATDGQDEIEVFNDASVMGALSMTSYIWQ